MDATRSSRRRTLRTQALRMLEDWSLELFDQVRAVFAEHQDIHGPRLAVFHAHEVEDHERSELREELRSVVLSSARSAVVLTPGDDAFTELVDVWDELRSALSSLYAEVAPAGLVLDLETNSFAAYDPTHCAECGDGPSAAGTLEVASTDALDPFAELLTNGPDHEANLDRIEELLLGRGLSTPTELVDDH